jgi:hypothetical protein
MASEIWLEIILYNEEGWVLALVLYTCNVRSTWSVLDVFILCMFFFILSVVYVSVLR